MADADNAFRNTNWTHHEGSLNCYDGFGADASSWQAHRSGVDLATCKAACLEEASCTAIVVKYYDDAREALEKGNLSCWLRDSVEPQVRVRVSCHP